MKKFFILLVIGLAVLVVVICAANVIALQSPVNQVISSDSRNAGIEVSAHFGSFVNPRVLVFDIHNVAGSDSEADVFRVFLQFADKMQSASFDRVELACKGNSKFFIRGAYFQQLGREYAFQNPIYTTQTFPENVFNLDGTPAYGTWQGGFIGVDLHQIQDFNDLQTKWWRSDLATN